MDIVTLCILGIIMNVLITFGFGIYKALNLSGKQARMLFEKYPIKTNMMRLSLMWLVPWLGFIYVFYEISILQRVLNSGKGVYEYLEYKLQRAMENQ